MSDDSSPSSFNDFLGGTGLVLTALLIWNVVVLFQGGDPVGSVNPPTNQDPGAWAAYDAQKRSINNNAFLFFVSFLGPILLCIAWRNQKVSPTKESRMAEIRARLSEYSGSKEEPDLLLEQFFTPGLGLQSRVDSNSFSPSPPSIVTESGQAFPFTSQENCPESKH